MKDEIKMIMVLGHLQRAGLMSLNRAMALFYVSEDEGCDSKALGKVLNMGHKESRPLALGLVKLGFLEVEKVSRIRGKKLKYRTTDKARQLIKLSLIELELGVPA